EDLEIKVSSFYRKVSNPVLSGLQLAWGDLSVYDVFPHPLSDLFSGSEVVLTGRYSGVGAKTIELSGARYGNRQRFAYETNFPAVATAHEFVPRLWAVRKIAYLQDQIRLHGESGELKQTIVKLAQEYGIITDYTAYLVLEEDDRAAQRGDPRLHFAQQIRRNQPLAARAKKAPHAEKAESGGAANRVSLRNNRMAGDAFNAYVLDFDAEENAPTLAPAILRAGNRTFYNTDGRWVDNLYIPDTDTIRIEAYSDEYYRLARRSRGVARTMALGERVVFVMDGRNYEIVPPL
ncbi:MAG: hypothetical protein GY842_13900, partial [bacterium]|nr:hypothetical protein [bacterium]